MAELERCIAFLRALDQRAAGRTLPFPFGIAHLHESVPRVWSRNYLVAEKNLEQASVELLAAEADRILGGVGLRHRKIEVHDAEVGTRLAPGFRELGWKAECDVLMVASREPDRTVDVTIAEEVPLEELAPVWAEGIRNDPVAGGDDEVAGQIVENKRIVSEAIPTRFFAARSEGEIASYCELYSDGRTGQIENVFTLEPHRKRGLARATISLALAESRRAGDDLTFLIADRDDWPKELYRKLGFDEIGFMYDFLRLPTASTSVLRGTGARYSRRSSSEHAAQPDRASPE